MSSIYDYEWDEEPIRKLEKDLEGHMFELHELMLEGNYLRLDDFTLMQEPYCGCEVCYSRETLALVIPRVIDLWTSNQIRLQHVYKEESDDLQLVQDSGQLEFEGELGK